MPDGDLLEVFHAPQIPVLADCAEIEARHAERLRPDLRVPAIEAAEVKVGRAVGEPPRLDRVEVVDQEQKDIAIRGVEGRRVAGDIDARVVDGGRPVEDAGHLPARVARAVAGDALHGPDEFMVVDAPIVRAGDGAKLHPSVISLERLDLLGAMRGQPVLQIDPGERRRELAQISGGCAHQRGELAEAPVGGCDGRFGARQHESQAVGVVAGRLDADGGAFDRPGPAAFGAAADGREQIG